MSYGPFEKLYEARGMLHTLSFTEKDDGKYDAIEHVITLIDSYIQLHDKEKPSWYENIGKVAISG